MKALIWIGCIFGASFVETLLHNAGIGGALPTIAVYGVGFALARHFCKKHEEKQREVPVKSDMSEPLGTQNFGAKQEERTIAEVSATCDCSEAELEDTPTAEGVIAKSAGHLDGEAAESENTSDVEISREALPEITETESPSREIQEETLNMESAGQETDQIGNQTVQQADQDGKQSGAKKRYCKRCGALVDQKTKKCTSCGKQYLHVTKHLWIALFSIICCALVGLNVLQYTQRVSMEREIKQATTTISKLKKKAEFMDNYVVIVGSSNKKYHKYGCKDLDLPYYFVFNAGNAKAQGYRACKKCN